jgi:flagellar basal body-associated protein FliL
MKMLLPVILAVLGLVGGAAAGWLLKPPPPPPPCLDAEGKGQAQELCAPPVDEAKLAEPEPTPPAEAAEYVRLERPFVVPVMRDERIVSLVVASLSIEMPPGAAAEVTAREPRLRDSLLRALFDHAYGGGFTGDFTAAHVMRDLRRGLLVAARSVLGQQVRDVLVVDIMRQDQ